jgi:hypothetical protein
VIASSSQALVEVPALLAKAVVARRTKLGVRAAVQRARMVPAGWPKAGAEVAEGEAVRVRVAPGALGAITAAIPVVQEHWARAAQAVSTAHIPPKATVTEAVAAGATTAAAVVAVAPLYNAARQWMAAAAVAGRHTSSRVLQA